MFCTRLMTWRSRSFPSFRFAILAALFSCALLRLVHLDRTWSILTLRTPLDMVCRAYVTDRLSELTNLPHKCDTLQESVARQIQAYRYSQRNYMMSCLRYLQLLVLCTESCWLQNSIDCTKISPYFVAACIDLVRFYVIFSILALW